MRDSFIEDARTERTTQILTFGALLGISLLIAVPRVEALDTAFFFYLMFWIAITMSVNLIFGFTGYIPFGYFAFYGIGAYAAVLGYIHFRIPMLGGAILAGIAALVLGVIFLPMFRLDGIYFAIGTFAAAWAIRIGITLTPEDITGGATSLLIADAYAPDIAYYAMVTTTVAVVVTSVWLNRSRYGTLLRAIRDDSLAAETCGINRTKLRSGAWFLSAFFPGVLGALDVWYTTVLSPESGFNVLLSIKPILYALFGGVGTILGPFLGGMVMYLIDDFIWQAIPLGSYLVTGLVLMLVVLVFPRGILGEFEHWQGVFGSEDRLVSIDQLFSDRGEK